MSLVFIAAFITMLASLSGTIFIWQSTGRWLRNNLRYLVTFSAGVFIVVVYNLFNESIEYGGSALLIVFTAILGALFLEIIARLIPTSHHHHGINYSHKHTNIDARRLLWSDAVHNIIDGVLLVPAFLIDIQVGITTTIGIFLHEVVQEISEFFILKEAGYSTLRALTLSFLVSSTILIGVFVGMFISETSAFIPALIAFAAGAFLYVVFRDLIPSTIQDVQRKKKVLVHIIAGVSGVLVILGVGMIAP